MVCIHRKIRIARQSNIQSTLADFGTKASINLFSEGSIEDFQELKADNIHLYLNDCLFTTFSNLVDADVLVIRKSSFSYTAGLFSKGIKMYDPFWHQPLKDWITINKLADFDELDFKNKVANKLLEGGLLKPE